MQLEGFARVGGCLVLELSGGETLGEPSTRNTPAEPQCVRFGSLRHLKLLPPPSPSPPQAASIRWACLHPTTKLQRYAGARHLYRIHNGASPGHWGWRRPPSLHTARPGSHGRDVARGRRGCQTTCEDGKRRQGGRTVTALKGRTIISGVGRCWNHGEAGCTWVKQCSPNFNATDIRSGGVKGLHSASSSQLAKSEQGSTPQPEHPLWTLPPLQSHRWLSITIMLVGQGRLLVWTKRGA